MSIHIYTLVKLRLLVISEIVIDLVFRLTGKQPVLLEKVGEDQRL